MDLNRACPKDSYPFPRIDTSTARYQLLCFMDTFFGYNQIKLNEVDQEKSSLVTNQGLFCYKVMPFGLKNTGAMYQRLMNRMFVHQIGRNVQLYVDDMLVKSIQEDDHMSDSKRPSTPFGRTTSESKQVRVWLRGDGRKVPEIYGIPKGY